MQRDISLETFLQRGLAGRTIVHEAEDASTMRSVIEEVEVKFCVLRFALRGTAQGQVEIFRSPAEGWDKKPFQLPSFAAGIHSSRICEEADGCIAVILTHGGRYLILPEGQSELPCAE